MLVLFLNVVVATTVAFLLNPNEKVVILVYTSIL